MSKGFINKSQYLHMFFWRRSCFTFLIFFNLRIRSKYVFGSLTKNPWFLYILHIIILYLWSLSNLSDVILNYTLIRTKLLYKFAVNKSYYNYMNYHWDNKSLEIKEVPDI